MRARAVAVAGLVAVLGLSVGAAHASTLEVTPGTVTTHTAQACSPGTVMVDETGGFLGWLFGWTGVQLTVPAACAGADLDLTIYTTSGGAVQATATVADVTPGTLAVTTSATYGGLLRPAASIAVTFDGWSVPASF